MGASATRRRAKVRPMVSECRDPISRLVSWALAGVGFFRSFHQLGNYCVRRFYRSFDQDDTRRRRPDEMERADEIMYSPRVKFDAGVVNARALYLFARQGLGRLK